MRILILSDSDSPHTIKWVKSLALQNIEIGLFSIHKANLKIYGGVKNLRIYDLGIDRKLQSKGEKDLSKVLYFKGIIQLKKILKIFKPDILHAHYASSYGLLGSISNFHPLVISVWGSDIYNFPKRSLIHKAIIKFNLSKADQILSTSYTMKREIENYTSKEIIVTPFGIDIELFKPKNVKRVFEQNDLVIGTIKTLEKKYGIEYLIRAFSIVKKNHNTKSLKLLIVGKGSQEQYLKNLVKELGIQNDTVFTGYINHEIVQDYHNMIDINVSASTEDSESFGVAVLEASACGKPVIVSNVGGLPEVVENEKTGFIVEKENPYSIADALNILLSNEQLRNQLGTNGRTKVIKEYNWIDSVDKIIFIYNSILKNFK